MHKKKINTYTYIYKPIVFGVLLLCAALYHSQLNLYVHCMEDNNILEKQSEKQHNICFQIAFYLKARLDDKQKHINVFGFVVQFSCS